MLDVSRHGRVVVLTLARPEHGNRLTAALAAAVAAALDAARVDADVRACVLTGAGGVFCVGGDYQGAGTTDAGRNEYARALIEMDRAMARLGKPLVAAVNGAAHAGGLAVVASCDLAVAAADATFGLPEVASGLFPFIALAIVRDALPKKVLFDLIYAARLIDAQHARELHVVNDVVPRAALLERALALAERAGSLDPAVLRLGRGLYYRLRGLSDSEYETARVALLEALAARDHSQKSSP
jgi:enoyl-CoA hydratase/carnithine racemase